MYIAIRVIYIIGTILIGLFLYYQSSIFKKMSTLSIEEMNEDEEDKGDLVNEKEGKLIKYIGTAIFVLIGFFVWAYLGTTIGKIASEITNHSVLKWFCYVFMYFIFLRLPFGFGNRSIKNKCDLKEFSEKIIFSLTMISFYIFSICCFDMIPKIFKWHLFYLN